MDSNFGLVAVLVALQFAAFGWRINREIDVSDEDRKSWLPLPDLANMVAFLGTAAACVLLPLKTGSFGPFPLSVLAAGYVLIAFHPITMAAHYGLFRKGGRPLVRTKEGDEKGGDYPYATTEEIVIFVCSLVVSAVVICVFLCGAAMA